MTGKALSNHRSNPPLSDSIWEMFSMKGKVVSITGGAGGIGFEVAKGFAEAGASVAIWYSFCRRWRLIRYNTSKKAVECTELLARQYGVTAKAYQCNVRDHKSVNETVAEVIQDFGKVDCMIVNHGIPSRVSVLDGTYEDWNKVIDVNLNGSFYVAKVRRPPGSV
jgi:sorbose reductase